MAAGHLLERDVVARGEPDVLLVSDKLDVGEPLRHHVGAAIAGGIVDDEHFDIEIGGCFGDGAQRLLEQIPGVVAEKYYAQVHGANRDQRSRATGREPPVALRRPK